MKRSLLLLHLLLFLTCVVNAQTIISGPMLGFVEMREVAIWAQTDLATEFYLAYWQKDGESSKQNSSNKSVTWVKTSSSAETGFTSQIVLTSLAPGIAYEYQFFNSERTLELSPVHSFTTQPLWQWRSDAPDWTLATGSCNYINEEDYDRPGQPYGKGTGIFREIAVLSPDAMVWLGDNTYFREPDWSSKEGMIHRYTHTRGIEDVQPLLPACAHYAIWDDHDFGPNDSDGSFVNKKTSKEVFDLFWMNPGDGVPGLDGITGQARLFDADLFLLDNRYYRSHPDMKTLTPTVLGEVQMDWLISALKFSTARFKIIAIGGQLLSDYAAYENYAMYENERKRLLERLEQEGIGGLIVLSGDRHHSELSKLEFEDGRCIYELTCSPLTSTSYDHSKEPNSLRVPDTHYGSQNFGLLHFEGSDKDRRVRIVIHDALGEVVWEKVIPASELYPEVK